MKKSVVAVFNQHQKAINAAKYLAKHGIPDNELSIVGKGDLVEDHIHFVPVKKYKKIPLLIGIIGGAILGVLAGTGMVDIPVLNAFSDSGGFVGLLAGVVLGAVLGAILSIAVSLVIRKDDLVVLQKHVDNGKYTLVVTGSEEDILKSRKLLHTENIHEDIVDLQGK